MATITITQYLNFKWNTDGGTPLIDHFFAAIDDGTGNSTTRTLNGDGEILVVEGTNLAVDADGIFTSGTITAVHTYFTWPDEAFSLSGLSVDVAAARTAWEAELPYDVWGDHDHVHFDASAVDADGDGAGIGRYDGAGASDSLVGSNGFETLVGFGGNDTLHGLDGNDTLYGEAGNDSIDGGADDDQLYGYTGRDTLIGGSGKDSLGGWNDADSLSGGSGDDELAGGTGKDTIDGGSGTDLAWYDEKTKSVTVTLNTSHWATVKVNGVSEDRIRNVEQIAGGSAGDKLTGDSRANTLWGNHGNDKLSGSGGNDWLIGSTGNDTLSGGSGLDSMQGGSGKDTLDGGSSWDTADYTDKTKQIVVTLDGSHYATVKVNGAAEDKIKNIENLWGGSGSDKITGDSKPNYLWGGDGHDTLSGGPGWDSLEGGAGHDVLTSGTGNDQFWFAGAADADADTITDFNVSNDAIVLYTSFFTDVIDVDDWPQQFRQGTVAETSDDRIIYDQSSGKLYFDVDGVGGDDQVLIATLTNKASLSDGNFYWV